VSCQTPSPPKKRRLRHALVSIIIWRHGNLSSPKSSPITTSKSSNFFNAYLILHVNSTDDRNGFIEDAQFKGQQTPPHKYEPINYVIKIGIKIIFRNFTMNAA
jgi:hypothetical protein